MKRTLACLVAAASLGCTAGSLKGMGYTVGADYWTAELDASMEPDGGGSVVHGDLGMNTEADVYDLRFAVASRKRGTRQAERWLIGFWYAKYLGAVNPGSDLTFGDAIFSAGDEVSTDATFMAYRIAYEEATVTAGKASTGWLGLVFFTFNVSSTQGGATPEAYTFEKKNIPALTVGYRFEEYRGKVSYYLSGEWMDLGVFKLGGASGQHLATSVGVRWNVSPKVFVAGGYKYFDGEYDYGGNKAHFKFQGLTLGGEVRC